MMWRTVVWVLVAAGCARYAEGERGQDCDPYVEYCPPECDPYEDPECEPTDNCPEGEVCSDETPDGLEFGGAPFGDSLWDVDLGPPPTANGGTQTVSVHHDGGSPFTLDFDATGGTAFEVTELARPDVLIRGVAEGSSHLRIVEPGTGELFDRISLPIVDVDTVELTPRDIYFRFIEDDEGVLPPWGILRGVDVDVVVRLRGGPSGVRLVDESLSFTSSLATVNPVDGSWDTFTVDASAGTIPFSATTGDGVVHALAVPFVSAIDDIEPHASILSGDLTQPIGVNSTSTYCFVAKSADLLVLAGSFTFTAEPGLEINTSIEKNCLTAKATVAGSLDLTVSAGGFSRTFTIVAQAMAARPAAAPLLPAGAPSRALGERAADALSGRSDGSTRWQPAPGR